MYLIHFIVLLNPVFNCSKRFVSFSFDKVTYNFVSFLLDVAPDGATIAGLSSSASLVVISAKTQFLDQVKVNCPSQLINGIFKLLQKLLKCSSGTTTFALVNGLLSSAVFLTILVLYLKDSELGERGVLGSSL